MSQGFKFGGIGGMGISMCSAVIGVGRDLRGGGVGRGVVGADIADAADLPRLSALAGIITGGIEGGTPTAEGGGVGMVALPSLLSDTGDCRVLSSLGAGSSFILMMMS